MNSRTLVRLLGLLVVVSMLLVACAPAATPAPAAPAAEPTKAPPTAATEPTKAPEPTAVPPTAVPEPTTAPAAAGEPKILRVRLYGDISNMDPAFVKSQNDWVVGNTILNGLVAYAPGSYDLVNELVESYEQSADGKTISFKLKPGIKWQKGYGEVTAEDVKFSFERIANPDLKSPYADDWKTLDHVEVTDTYSGKIILKEPFAPLWHSTLPVTSGRILPKKYVEEVGAEKFATEPIGTGPYMFKEWKPKEAVVVVRNPDYYGEPGYWDEIHFIPIDDDNAAEIALEAGELDFTRIGIGSVDRFSANANFSVVKKPSLRYRWIGMDVENPKLQDINVRQAIRYAIDVPSILKVAYMGQVEQEKTLVPPGLVGYWADAPTYQQDLAKAKEYMAKAGLTSLDLRMDIQDTAEYRAWAEVAQQNLKEIGINLTINPMDSTSFWDIGTGDKGKEVELFAQNYSMQPDPAWAAMWFTCEQIGVWNWQRWCDKDWDALYQKGLVTLDEQERSQVYIDMEKIWDSEAHAIWITHGVLAYAHNPAIAPAVSPHGEPQVQFFKPAK